MGEIYDSKIDIFERIFALSIFPQKCLVIAKILILSYKISIFAFSNIVLEQRYLDQN